MHYIFYIYNIYIIGFMIKNVKRIYLTTYKCFRDDFSFQKNQFNLVSFHEDL